jgi:hypothetical protein
LLNRLGVLLQPVFESSPSTARWPRFGPDEVVVHGCQSFLYPIAEAAGLALVLGPQSFQAALDVSHGILEARHAPLQFSGLSAAAPG